MFSIQKTFFVNHFRVAHQQYHHHTQYKLSQLPHDDISISRHKYHHITITAPRLRPLRTLPIRREREETTAWPHICLRSHTQSAILYTNIPTNFSTMAQNSPPPTSRSPKQPRTFNFSWRNILLASSNFCGVYAAGHAIHYGDLVLASVVFFAMMASIVHHAIDTKTHGFGGLFPSLVHRFPNIDNNSLAIDRIFSYILGGLVVFMLFSMVPVEKLGIIGGIMHLLWISKLGLFGILLCALSESWRYGWFDKNTIITVRQWNDIVYPFIHSLWHIVAFIFVDRIIGEYLIRYVTLRYIQHHGGMVPH